MHDSPRRGLAVGFFDGVHLGHRAILAGAAEALTFRNHPLTVLAPARAPKLLMDFETRVGAIRAAGVASVTVLDFTSAFARMPPEAFAAQYLAGRGPIRCGANWRFGAGGAGDAAYLKRLGFEVEVVPSVGTAGMSVSSTRIRAALAAGDVGAAEAMLGHGWTMGGRVVPGKGEGRALGYPTVNVDPLEEPPLAHGVYEVEVAGVRALANWGVAPTYRERAWAKPVLEIHFADGGSGALGERALPCGEDARVDVRIVRFIRPERTFPDLNALRAAIAADIAAFRTQDRAGTPGSPHRNYLD